MSSLDFFTKSSNPITPSLGASSGASSDSTSEVPPPINPTDHPALTSIFGALNKGLQAAAPYVPSAMILGPIGAAAQALSNTAPVKQIADSLNPLSKEKVDKWSAAAQEFSKMGNKSPLWQKQNEDLAMGLAMPGEGDLAPEATSLVNEVETEGESLLSKFTGQEPNTLPSSAPVLRLGEKPSQLAETVKAGEQFPSEVKAGVSSSYTPITNKETTDAAQKAIAEDPTAALSHVLGGESLDATGFEKARLLAKQAVAEGRTSDAVDIIKATTQKATTAGQSVQALRLWGELTPESALKVAQQSLDEANKTSLPVKARLVPPKILTPEAAQKITGAAQALATTAVDSPERAAATKAVIDAIAEAAPSTLTDKVIDLWKTGLLSNPGTLGKKLVGDTMMQGLETAKDPLAAIFDKLASLKTGERTVTPSLKGSLAGFENIGKAGERLTEHGAIAPITSKVNYASGNERLSPALKTTADFLAKIPQFYSDITRGAYGAITDTFKLNSLMRSLNQQAIVEAMNQGLKGKEAEDLVESLLANPTLKMKAQAAQDAAYASFARETPVSEALKGGKKILAKLGGPAGQVAGETLLPFVQTPVAIATSMYDYSPFSIPENIAKLAGGDQRGFAQGMGRATLGTGMIGGAALLHRLGGVSGPSAHKETDRFPAQMKNELPSSVNVNGNQIQLSQLGVPGGAAAMGSALDTGLQQNQSKVDLIHTLASAGLQTIAGETGLKGLQPVMEASSNPNQAVSTAWKNLTGSIVPNIIKRAMAGVPTPQTFDQPGAATVKPQTLMQKVEQGLSNVLYPFETSKLNVTPESQKIQELHDSGFPVSPIAITKSQTIGGATFQMDPKMLGLVQRSTGGEQGKWLTANLSALNAMDTSVQQKYIQKNFTEIYDKIRYQILAPQIAQEYKRLLSVPGEAGAKQLHTFENSGVMKNPSVMAAIAQSGS